MPPRPRRTPAEAAALLRDHLAELQLPPGARLPTQAELSSHLGVGVGLTAKAVQMLVAEGVLTARQGSGTFIAATQDKPAALTWNRSAGGILHAPTGSGASEGAMRAETDTPTASMAPPAAVATVFETDAAVCRRTTVWRDERGALVGVEEAFYSDSLAQRAGLDRLDVGPGGVYGALARVGAAPVDYREEVGWHLPTPSQAARLHSGERVVLHLHRTGVDESGRVVEVSITAVRDGVIPTYKILP